MNNDQIKYCLERLADIEQKLKDAGLLSGLVLDMVTMFKDFIFQLLIDLDKLDNSYKTFLVKNFVSSSEKTMQLLPGLEEMAKDLYDAFRAFNDEEQNLNNEPSQETSDKKEESDTNLNNQSKGGNRNKKSTYSLVSNSKIIRKDEWWLSTVYPDLEEEECYCSLPSYMKDLLDTGLYSIEWETTSSIESERPSFYILYRKTPKLMPIKNAEAKLEKREDRQVIINKLHEIDDKLRFDTSTNTINEFSKLLKLDNSLKIYRPPSIKMIPHSHIGHTILAIIILYKFCFGLPLNRQSNMLLMQGFYLSRQALSALVIAASRNKKIQYLYNKIKEIIRLSGWIRIDETPVFVFIDGKLVKLYFWVIIAGKHSKIRYYYYGNRSTDTLTEIIGDHFNGKMQSDGYIVYPSYAKDKDNLILVSCLTHIRRYFVEVIGKRNDVQKLLSEYGFSLDKYCNIDDNSIGTLFSKFEALKNIQYRIAIYMILLINIVFSREKDIQEKAAELKLSEKEYEKFVVDMRYKTIKPLLDYIYSNLKKIGEKGFPEKSKLMKAVSYTLEHWPGVENYLDSPYLEPSNNPIERIVRGIAMGREAYFFYGSESGAEAGAIWFTFIESAKANGLNPLTYLEVLFDRLAWAITEEELDSLLPWNIQLHPDK